MMSKIPSETLDKFLAVLMTLSRSDTKYITVAGKVDLKAMYQTNNLVSTQMAGLMKMIVYKTLAKNLACITAKGITDV